MGAWSHEPFGNDTACDWAYGLDEAEDLSYVEAALDNVLAEPDEYLDADAAAEAVAALEVLAKLLGHGTQSDTYTEEVDAWVARIGLTPEPVLRDKALQALQRIVGDNSELPELWADSADDDAWRAGMASLRDALAA